MRNLLHLSKDNDTALLLGVLSVSIPLFFILLS